MNAVPAGALCAATVAMGLTLARGYVRGRRRPMLNSVHLLLGAGSLEALAVMQQGLNDEADPHRWSMVKLAMGLFAAALMLGLTSQLVRPQSTPMVHRVLVTHACCGMLGFVLFLIWVAR
jgi:hypothetical protein